MLRVYIIRHAQSANNALADQGGRVADPGLTSLGEQQAAILAEQLAIGDSRDIEFDIQTGFSINDSRAGGFGITHLYTSAMHRALLTTQPIARLLDIPIHIWRDIHEEGGVYLDEGSGRAGKPGKTSAEIAAEFPGFVIPEDVTHEGWWGEARGYESRADAFERARRVASVLRERAESSDVIALVTHGTFIDRLLKMLLGQAEDSRFFYLHYNAAITRLDFLDQERILLRYVNRSEHLPAEMVS
jgi:2,3-bisphosphoglycerate-dependent phosphoglycerate mutase/probable phosphoglycerate mutase